MNASTEQCTEKPEDFETGEIRIVAANDGRAASDTFL